MFGLDLHRDLDPDPRGLEADDLNVVGHVLPVRMVIALAFFKRIFTRSLPMNQAHGSIIEVTEPVALARTRRSGAPEQTGKPGERHAQKQLSAIAKRGAEIRSDRQTFRLLWSGPSRPVTTRARGRSSGSVSRRSRASPGPGFVRAARCNSSRPHGHGRDEDPRVEDDRWHTNASRRVLRHRGRWQLPPGG